MKAIAGRELILRKALEEVERMEGVESAAASQARAAHLNVAASQLKAIEELVGLYRNINENREPVQAVTVLINLEGKQLPLKEIPTPELQRLAGLLEPYADDSDG